MVDFKPIKPRKMYVEIAEQISDAISRGEYKEEQKLPSERDLSSLFGVSRSSIREALTVLEAVGMIRIEIGQGTFITHSPGLQPFGKHQISPVDLMEARVMFEQSIVDLIIQRASKPHLDRLEKTISEMEQLIHAPDRLTEFYEWGVEFHRVLSSLSGNDVLDRIGRSLLVDHPVLRLLNRQGIISEDARQKQIDEHRNILIALRNRDIEASREMVNIHLRGLENFMFD
ncbi:MAG: FadR/GntR family transcriptional regulator [Bacilli bacterium]